MMVTDAPTHTTVALHNATWTQASTSERVTLVTQHHQLAQEVAKTSASSFFIIKCESHLAWMLTGLSFMVAINIVLLAWILSHITLPDIVVDSESSPQRIIIPGNVWLSGRLQANVMQASQPSTSLLISSPAANRIELGPATIHNHSDQSWFHLTPDRAVAFTNKLIVRSSLDDHLLLLLQCKPNEHSSSASCEPNVVLGVDCFELLGAGGLNISNSVQVPLLQSSSSLFLHSPTRRINMRAVKEVKFMHIVSHNDSRQSSNHVDEFGEDERKRDIDVTAKRNIVFRSKRHKIVLHNVRFTSRFKLVHSSRYGKTYATVGQVCLCANTGKVFMTNDHRNTACQEVARHTGVCHN